MEDLGGPSKTASIKCCLGLLVAVDRSNLKTTFTWSFYDLTWNLLGPPRELWEL